MQGVLPAFRSPFSPRSPCVPWSLPVLSCDSLFVFCPCKAQGCVGCRQHSLSAGGLRPLASPKSKGGKGGQSFSSGVAPWSSGHSRSQRIACARDWNLCSKRKSSSDWKRKLIKTIKRSTLLKFYLFGYTFRREQRVLHLIPRASRKTLRHCSRTFPREEATVENTQRSGFPV